MSENPNRFVPIWTPEGVRWVDREDMTMPPFENLAQRDLVEWACHTLNGTRPAGEMEALRCLNIAAAGVFRAWQESKATPLFATVYGVSGEIGETSPSNNFVRAVMPRMARTTGLDRYVDAMGTMDAVSAALAGLARYISATPPLPAIRILEEIERRGGLRRLAQDANRR